MTEGEITPVENSKVVKPKTRPVILSVLCLFSFVFLALFSLLFLAGLLNAGWITTVTNQYLASSDFTKTQTFFILGSGFLLHGIAFAGVLMIWKLRKTGYYMVTVCFLILALIQTLFPEISVTVTALYIVIIILFGLFFSRLR